jgi:hypothetical protein
MTSTRALGHLLASMAGIALVLGGPISGRCQLRNEELVELFIEDSKSPSWIVRVSDNQVIAEKFRPGDRTHVVRNFEESADWMEVDGRYMGYDLEGRSKSVLARERRDESTGWEKTGYTSRQKNGGRFGMRLRARNGAFKGWWVGMEVTKDKPEPGKPALARLVLVEHEKDAVVFRWGDPRDVSP